MLYIWNCIKRKFLEEEVLGKFIMEHIINRQLPLKH